MPPRRTDAPGARAAACAALARAAAEADAALEALETRLGAEAARADALAARAEGARRKGLEAQSCRVRPCSRSAMRTAAAGTLRGWPSSQFHACVEAARRGALRRVGQTLKNTFQGTSAFISFQGDCERALTRASLAVTHLLDFAAADE